MGDAYRDVLATADAVAGMKTSVDRVLTLVDGLEAGVKALAASAASGGGAGATAAAAATAGGPPPRLHALGARVRYLLDTPDAVGGATGAGMAAPACGGAAAAAAARAAARLARAGEVHRLLTSRATDDVARKFPLLARAWPGVATCRAAALARARAAAAARVRLPRAAAARALAAACVLGGGRCGRRGVRLCGVEGGGTRG